MENIKTNKAKYAKRDLLGYHHALGSQLLNGIMAHLMGLI
jgi:hypothetical protein